MDDSRDKSDTPKIRHHKDCIMNFASAVQIDFLARIENVNVHLTNHYFSFTKFRNNLTRTMIKDRKQAELNVTETQEQQEATQPL